MYFLTAFKTRLQICSHKASFRGKVLKILPGGSFACSTSPTKVPPLSHNVKRNQNKSLSPSTPQGQTDRVEAWCYPLQIHKVTVQPFLDNLTGWTIWICFFTRADTRSAAFLSWDRKKTEQVEWRSMMRHVLSSVRSAPWAATHAAWNPADLPLPAANLVCVQHMLNNQSTKQTATISPRSSTLTHNQAEESKGWDLHSTSHPSLSLWLSFSGSHRGTTETNSRTGTNISVNIYQLATVCALQPPIPKRKGQKSAFPGLRCAGRGGRGALLWTQSRVAVGCAGVWGARCCRCVRPDGDATFSWSPQQNNISPYASHTPRSPHGSSRCAPPSCQPPPVDWRASWITMSWRRRPLAGSSSSWFGLL